MISYKGQLNEGNAALGTEKTITANEDIRTCDLKALAREINHQNALIPEDVAASVLGYFCKAAVQKMAEGFAVQLTSGSDVAIRIYPDVHIKGGNINLERAKQLDPSVTKLTEDVVGQLIDKAGVQVRVRATCMQKFTDMLEAEDYQLSRTGIETKAYVERKGEQDADEPSDTPATPTTPDNGSGEGDHGME